LAARADLSFAARVEYHRQSIRPQPFERRQIMLRPKTTGAPISSLNDVKGRPLSMTLPPGVRERRDVMRRDAIVRRIVAEFRDMPGLVLSVKQASRFLGVEPAACARILEDLMRAGLLRRDADQRYGRSEAGH
jgi:hypothetical protein